MAKTRLTESRYQGTPPPEECSRCWDLHEGSPRTCLPAGQKRYFVHFQHEGRRIWNVVGDAAVTRLADAREKARSMMVATRRGACPQTDQTLFETVAAEVFHRYGRSNWKPRTLKVNRYYLKNQLLPWFQGPPQRSQHQPPRSDVPGNLGSIALFFTRLPFQPITAAARFLHHPHDLCGDIWLQNRGSAILVGRHHSEPTVNHEGGGSSPRRKSIG